MQQSEIEMCHLPAISIYGYVGVETFILGQSIGIDETNTVQLKFFT